MTCPLDTGPAAVDSSANQPEGPHFGVAALHRDLTEGLDARCRLLALDHLGHGCPVCMRRLERLAEELFGGADPIDATALPPASDPVSRTIWRRLVVVAGPAVAEVEPVLGPLGPAHRYYLEDGWDQPLAFCRAVLEESRHGVLTDSGHTAEDLKATVNQLADSRLRRAHPETFWDLQALGHAYLADEYRVAGDYNRAVELLRQSDRERARGSGDPEVHATVHEIRADLARAQGQLLEALDHLQAAADLLVGCVIPARRAETFLRRGLTWMRSGAGPRAKEAFDDARTAIPQGAAPRLLLEAEHYLALLAAKRGKFEVAREHLKKAGPLYRQYGSPLLEAQRAWLSGVILLRSKPQAPKTEEEIQRTEEELQSALTGLRQVGTVRDQIVVLSNLAELYHRTGRWRELGGITNQVRDLFWREETRPIVEMQLQEIIDRLRRSGIPVPELAELLNWPQEPIN